MREEHQYNYKLNAPQIQSDKALSTELRASIVINYLPEMRFLASDILLLPKGLLWVGN